ncbi:MAG: NAD(P)-dependent oxidoreductase [Acidaminococcaceae bacterium]|nr:NAD(P)-dependent oxidoreductase [Acidaminococcaceae bacterium]MDD4722308.1 NAD(P)-dependent oxidoreductase [Acidaminococcaceae bacterium]
MNIGIFTTAGGGGGIFQEYIKKHSEKLTLIELEGLPTIENLRKLKENNCTAMIYISDHQESGAFFQTIAEQGVKYICCCSAGYEYLNLEAMKKYGIKGANVPEYSPNAISEHTVMLLLALLRKLRTQILRVEVNNFTRQGLQGQEVRNMTIGIVGAGRIGYTTLQCLSGFNPKKIYVYDHLEKEKVKKYAEYASLNTLYKESDVVIYHCSYNEENYHMVNAKTLAEMKDNVILINVARGPLFDMTAVLEGLGQGKIGALGLDVIEGEGLLKKSKNPQKCPLPILEKILQYENVIFTSHTAYYTDEAIRNLSAITVENAYSYAMTGNCPNELVK